MARTYQLKTRPKSRLQIRYQDHLNDEQRRIVAAKKGPLLVLAGAGTGKTRTLTYRVAKMIDDGIDPAGIVLLTFTNRAAAQMIERCEELVGGHASRILGGTFHHVANVLLRKHAEAIGYKSNFTILDRDDCREVMGAAIVDADIQIKKGRFPKPDLLVDLASMAVNTETPVREVVVKRAPRFFQQADNIAAACRAYIERKVAMNLMDFDDLLMNLRVLLEEIPQIAKHIQTNAQAVFVDEYQDTNKLQGTLVDLLAGHHQNVTVVGDDAQCIYGFRGAEVKNMLEFKARYPDAEILPLTLNYRSTPEILELANASLAKSRVGFNKRLRTHRPAGALPAVVPCRDVEMQAEFVAQRTLELRDEGVPLSEVAVLYRAHSHSMEIQVEFQKRGIPFIVRSGLRFFEQAHIKDIVAVLKAVFNPEDELSFRRAIKLQEGIGNATCDQVFRAMTDAMIVGDHQNPQTLLAALTDGAGKRAKRGVETFVRLMFALKQPSMQRAPGDMVRLVLDDPPAGGGYRGYLKQHFKNDKDRIDDIEQLADYAGTFGTLEEFLSEISLLQNFAAEDVEGADDPDEKVTLSSVHQAKGLEWSRVFLPWLTDGRFPSDLALRDVDGDEEERRLFYVAVTRAKDELFLTYPQVHRTRDLSQTLLRRSRFVDELPPPEEEDGQTFGLYEVWQIQEVDPLLAELDELGPGETLPLFGPGDDEDLP